MTTCPMCGQRIPVEGCSEHIALCGLDDETRELIEASALHYHYGSNIPGYLPMADEPNICETWEGARDALADDIDRAADDAAAMYQAGDDDGSLMASYESALQEVRDWPEGQDIYVNVTSDGPHDLGISYWVTACAEDCALEDDQ